MPGAGAGLGFSAPPTLPPRWKLTKPAYSAQFIYLTVVCHNKKTEIAYIMKCPHCIVEINPNFSEKFLGKDSESAWSIYAMICPNPKCKKLIVDLACGQPKNPMSGLLNVTHRQTVRPFATSRPPVPNTVGEEFAKDYREACLIQSFSPKASAALSRRCLQNILREKSGIKHGNLASEIQQVIDSNSLPSHLSESLDVVRIIGNFAAHPIKSTSTGEIVDVEPGEAEWLLDVIEALFDFYFVQPAIIKGKRAALNKKLADSGKPTLK